MSAEKIRAILESGADIEDAVLASDDKDIFYHLSPLRENLLSWMDFKEDASILEINAECGALTGLLCKKAKHVTAVDPSKENCEINALRNKYDNLEIITGELKKLKLTQTFDYITIVGLPVKALKKTIAKAATLLNTDGQLILAGEGDSKLPEKLLAKAGFKKLKVCYPAPDHIVPLEIRTDTRSGSFLILAKKDGNFNQEVTYIKFACQRKPEFRIVTRICEDSVIKSPGTDKATDHIKNLASNKDKIASIYKSIVPVDCELQGNLAVFPFVEGQSLVVPQTNDEEFIQGVTEALGKVFDYKEEPKTFVITEEFKKIFGDVRIPEGELAYSVTNIDSNFDNFMTCGDKTYCIDYEWVFDFPVPVRFVKYRTLLYAGASSVLDSFGYAEEDIRLFHSMEIAFQQYVSGEDFKYIIKPSSY